MGWVVLVLGGSWVGQLATFPSSSDESFPDELSSTVSASSLNAAYIKEWGPVLLLLSPQIWSPLLISLEPALLFHPGKMQGPLS